jgi:SagB-type dehydrogenase family enzyme
MFNPKKEIENNRKAIKPDWTKLSDANTDRSQKKERPPFFTEPAKNKEMISLDNSFPHVSQKSLQECIQSRRSLRKYSDTPLTFEEMSYLLYDGLRVMEFRNEKIVFRTFPTGGARNAMENYVYIHHVEGIPRGLYHYVQNHHALQLIDGTDDIEERVNKALMNQLRGSAIVVFLTTVPYRSEYAYSFTAHKMIAMEAGHCAQNISLAAEVIDSGAVCIAAYDQEKMDQLLQVDGVEEFTTYAVCVGKR